MAHVLVVEDEAELAMLISREIEGAGHIVTRADDGPGAVDLAARVDPDIILLDVMLPGFDGIEVLRRVRQSSSVPILMLTARSTELDKVLGLELGADDYLTKPFSMRELQARVGAILRRAERIRQFSATEPAEQVISQPGMTIDVAAHTVVVDGADVALTATEFSLLRILASHPGRVFSREFLLEDVWGDDAVVFDRTVDSHIQRLRKKLGAAGQAIETVWGVGYRFSNKGRQ